MSKVEVMERIREIGLVPVVRADTGDEAVRAVDAIQAGGVPVLEITMTVPGAIRAIEEVAKRYDANDVLIGAGTVLDAETARICILSGARFVVSPSLNLATIECCRRYSVPVLPGALTPTEVVAAWQAGADCVKVFPAGALGGASYLKALKAPLPQVEMIPTGGVSLQTAADFIRAGAMALGVGADLVDVKALRENRAQIITERAKQYAQIVRDARAGLAG